MDFAPPLPELGLCPFGIATGKPCPLCGGTRAVVSLARSDLEMALQYNAFVVMLLGLFAVIILFSFTRAFSAKMLLRPSLAEIWNKMRTSFWPVGPNLIGILLISWVWNFARW